MHLLSRLLPCVFVLSFLAAPAAFAQRNIEVGAGISYTRDNEDTAVVMVAWLPEWRQWHGGDLQGELGVIHLWGRNQALRNLEEDVTVAHVGARYEHRDNGLVLGFGVGAQSGQTNALSGGPQFVSTLGWRWNRFTVLARHISNASLHAPNHGETMLLMSRRFY